MHLNQIAEKTSGLIMFLLEVEKEPSTRHTHYFKDYRRKFFAFYKGIYNSSSNSNFIDRLRNTGSQSSEFREALETVISNLRRIGFPNVQPLELAVLRASEDSDDAIKIMADVRAYFQGMCPGLSCSGAEGFHRLTPDVIFQWPTSDSLTMYPRRSMSSLC